VGKMREAARAFVGMRNFASFTADEPAEKSTKVLVDGLELAEDGDLVLIRVTGSHFLWRMVRRMVGVLAAVGRGDLTPRSVGDLLGSESELPGRLTAPASGLFLERVFYRGDDPPGPIGPAAPVRGTR
jgi:tRNA pseudouridine38-40 synthase